MSRKFKERSYPPGKKELISDLNHVRESLLLALSFDDHLLIKAQINRIDTILWLLCDNSVGGYALKK